MSRPESSIDDRIAPNGDKWTSVVADWVTTSLLNGGVCFFAAYTSNNKPLGKTLKWLGLAETTRAFGYIIQSLAFRSLDDRIVNAISSFTYGSLWGITDILCIHYSMLKLSIIDPLLHQKYVNVLFYATYVFIFGTHWAIAIFMIIWYIEDKNLSDDVFKVLKFGAIGVLEWFLICQIMVQAFKCWTRLDPSRFKRQIRYERQFLTMTLARLLFSSLLYVILIISYFMDGNFPSVTQAIFIVDQIKRLLPTILVLDFLLTKIETMNLDALIASSPIALSLHDS